MTLSHHGIVRVCAISLWLISITLSHAQTTPPSTDASGRRWVHGSKVNVRSQPSANASVIATWVINTPIQVGKQANDWCHATSAQQVSGYVACNLIGASPVTLQQAYTRNAQGLFPEHTSARAFWIAPSVQRFLDFGNELNGSALSDEQRKQEEKSQRPVRFRIPEFDAMKQRLLEGVLPDITQEIFRVNFASMKPLREFLDYWRVDVATLEYLKRIGPATILPATKPSLFAAHGDVILFSESNVDALTAMVGQPSKIRFVGRPVWVTGRHSAGVHSIWDIGGVEAILAKPVVLHAVSYTGLVEARTIDFSEQLKSALHTDSCAEGFDTLPQGRHVIGYPRVKDRLVAWYMPNALPDKKIDIVSRKTQIVARNASGGKPPALESAVVHLIDLNRDQIADIAVIDTAVPTSPTVPPYGKERYFFVNIAGQWWFSGADKYGFCT
jgi:Bacterial SH3 domain